MSKVISTRVTAQIEGDFVVFLIGMRINKLWEAYARNADQLHWPAWVDFNKRIGGSRGDVGIWHETYRVRAGEYECVYSGMPPLGLAKATATTDAVGELESARGRIGGD